jgi:ribosomal protein S18 acetylase RimI-like enzyme
VRDHPPRSSDESRAPEAPRAPDRPASAPLIRRYAPRDFDAISDICRRTAERGEDATGCYVSDDLLPDIFARPYVTYEPELAFVLEARHVVCGYILGVADTARFVERYEREWLPGFSRKYRHVVPPATRCELMRHLGFTPQRMLIPELASYPAHLHIDILAPYRGQGHGRALIDALVAALRERAVPGLHLSLDPDNTQARAFYDRVGFRELPSSKERAPLLGLRIE